MSDDIKIGGISPGEYIRGVKNGNIDPTYDNAVNAVLWAADEIERLRKAKPLLRELFNWCMRCNDFRPDSSLGNRIVAFFR